MFKRIVGAALLVAASAAGAAAQSGYGYGYGTGSNSSSSYVRGHSNTDGSYTREHYRTNPNNTDLDNYGTRGNVNPYTGGTGSRSPRW